MLPYARVCAVLATAWLVACGDGAAGPADGDPVLVVTGGGQTDTIEARFDTPLSVQVTRDGRPVAGMQFRVTGNGVLLREPVLQLDLVEQIVATGPAGRVELAVVGESRVGPATVQVRAMDGSVSGEATFLIQPGAAAQIRITPGDTAVLAGAAFALGVTGLDRAFNPVAAPAGINFSALTPGVVTMSGPTATAVAHGRGRMQATAMVATGAVTAEAFVSVVPPGRLALTAGAIANTDGTRYRAFTGADFGSGGIASWAPDGNSLVYHEATFFAGSLRVSDLAGHSAPLIASGPGFEESSYPRFNSDGSWIYFTGTTHATNNGDIWRVHADGSGLERVGEPGGHQGGDSSPSPSPDGTRVVWASTRLLPENALPRLIVRDLATGTETDLGVTGSAPAWSPAGDAIAYWTGTTANGYGTVRVISPSGGAPVPALPDGVTVYSPTTLAWSPDGAWLAVGTGSSENGTILVRVSDLTVLPLPWSGARAATSWHTDPLP